MDAVAGRKGNLQSLQCIQLLLSGIPAGSQRKRTSEPVAGCGRLASYSQDNPDIKLDVRIIVRSLSV